MQNTICPGPIIHSQQSQLPLKHLSSTKSRILFISIDGFGDLPANQSMLSAPPAESAQSTMTLNTTNDGNNNQQITNDNSNNILNTTTTTTSRTTTNHYNTNYTQEDSSLLNMNDNIILPLPPKTPLALYRLPNLAKLSHSAYGLLDPVAPGLACGSDTAHLSLLGNNPNGVYRGRGALEGVGGGVSMPSGCIAFKSCLGEYNINSPPGRDYLLPSSSRPALNINHNYNHHHIDIDENYEGNDQARDQYDQDKELLFQQEHGHAFQLFPGFNINNNTNNNREPKIVPSIEHRHPLKFRQNLTSVVMPICSNRKLKEKERVCITLCEDLDRIVILQDGCVQIKDTIYDVSQDDQMTWEYFLTSCRRELKLQLDNASRSTLPLSSLEQLKHFYHQVDLLPPAIPSISYIPYSKVVGSDLTSVFTKPPKTPAQQEAVLQRLDSTSSNHAPNFHNHPSIGCSDTSPSFLIASDMTCLGSDVDDDHDDDDHDDVDLIPNGSNNNDLTQVAPLNIIQPPTYIAQPIDSHYLNLKQQKLQTLLHPPCDHCTQPYTIFGYCFCQVQYRVFHAGGHRCVVLLSHPKGLSDCVNDTDPCKSNLLLRVSAPKHPSPSALFTSMILNRLSRASAICLGSGRIVLLRGAGMSISLRSQYNITAVACTHIVAGVAMTLGSNVFNIPEPNGCLSEKLKSVAILLGLYTRSKIESDLGAIEAINNANFAKQFLYHTCQSQGYHLLLPSPTTTSPPTTTILQSPMLSADNNSTTLTNPHYQLLSHVSQFPTIFSQFPPIVIELESTISLSIQLLRFTFQFGRLLSFHCSCCGSSSTTLQPQSPQDQLLASACILAHPTLIQEAYTQHEVLFQQQIHNFISTHHNYYTLTQIRFIVTQLLRQLRQNTFNDQQLSAASRLFTQLLSSHQSHLFSTGTQLSPFFNNAHITAESNDSIQQTSTNSTSLLASRPLSFVSPITHETLSIANIESTTTTTSSQLMMMNSPSQFPHSPITPPSTQMHDTNNLLPLPLLSPSPPTTTTTLLTATPPQSYLHHCNTPSQPSAITTTLTTTNATSGDENELPIPIDSTIQPTTPFQSPFTILPSQHFTALNLQTVTPALNPANFPTTFYHIKTTDDMSHEGDFLFKANVLKNTDQTIGEILSLFDQSWDDWEEEFVSWLSNRCQVHDLTFSGQYQTSTHQHHDSPQLFQKPPHYFTEQSLCDDQTRETFSTTPQPTSNLFVFNNQIECLCNSAQNQTLSSLSITEVPSCCICTCSMPLPPTPIVICLLGDHSTPCSYAEHSTEPVPVLVHTIYRNYPQFETTSQSFHTFPLSVTNNHQRNLEPITHQSTRVTPTLSEAASVGGNLGRVRGGDILRFCHELAFHREQEWFVLVQQLQSYAQQTVNLNGHS